MNKGQTDNQGARDAAIHIVKRLKASGFTALFAGGCVRDMCMGRCPSDYDVATNAPPSTIRELFDHVIEVGAAFGVSRVLLNDTTTEVAAFRTDVGIADGRHPAAIRFCGPEEDARRRDFTINGMFFDPIENRVLDFIGGRQDIEHRLIRAIGDPAERFAEDYLRMLRAVRFAGTLDFEIESHTMESIRRLAFRVADISVERIQYELTRLLTESPHAGRALQLLFDAGLLNVILPEVAAMAGQAQSPDFHPEGDVFTHTIMMLDSMEPDRSATLAYAVLFHDIGKPPTAETIQEETGGERIRFHGHAAKGGELTEAIMKRLHMPSQLITDVVHCVCNHMRFMDVQRMRTAKLRRIIAAPTFEIELELHRLDCLNSHGDLGNYHFLRDFMQQIGNEPALPPPWITGNDILALGIPEGPQVGLWHRRAYEAQLENRFSSREELLTWIRESTQINRQA